MAEERGWNVMLNADSIATGSGPPRLFALSGHGFGWLSGGVVRFYSKAGASLGTYTVPTNLGTSGQAPTPVPGTDDVVIYARATGSGSVTLTPSGSVSFVSGDIVLIRCNASGASAAALASGSVASSLHGFIDVNAAGHAVATWSTSSTVNKYGVFDLSGTGSLAFSGTFYTSGGSSGALGLTRCGITESDVVGVMWEATISGVSRLYLDVDTNYDGTMNVTGVEHDGSNTSFDYTDVRLSHLGDSLVSGIYRFTAEEWKFYAIDSGSWSTHNLIVTYGVGSAEYSGFGANFAPLVMNEISTKLDGGHVSITYPADTNHTIDSGAGYSFTKPSGYDGGWVVVQWEVDGTFSKAWVVYVNRVGATSVGSFFEAVSWNSDGEHVLGAFGTGAQQWEIDSLADRSYTASGNRLTIMTLQSLKGWVVGQIGF